MRWSRRRRLLLGMLIWISTAGRVCAQNAEIDVRAEPMRYLLDYSALLRRDIALSETTPATSATPRLQMFRMPSGFLATPLGIISDDDLVEDPSAKTDDDLAFLQVTLGNHVPYLDMFKRGDPGGLGYYKIYSQAQIVDLGTTNVSLAMEAVTPMGVQNGGVGTGRTVVSPGLACFQDLGEGAAFHAYIGQHIATSSRLREQINSGFRCGMAVQHPVPLTTFNADQGLFVFVQAFAEYRMESYRTDGRNAAWEVVPGVQYRLNNACWMALGISRYNFLACTWQY